MANKVHFTNNSKEVEEFISVKQMPKELDGEEDWEYHYVEPVPGENDRMKDTNTRERLLAARGRLVEEFEAVTMQWIQHPEAQQATELKARRSDLATRLRQDYWTIDPYIRARSVYDRTGVLQPGGVINFYPEKAAGATAAAASNGATTAADDVD